MYLSLELHLSTTHVGNRHLAKLFFSGACPTNGGTDGPNTPSFDTAHQSPGLRRSDPTPHPLLPFVLCARIPQTPYHTTTQSRASSDAAEQRKQAAAVVTADAQTQARLPTDPEAAARAAVAAAALAQVSLSEKELIQKTQPFLRTKCRCLFSGGGLRDGSFLVLYGEGRRAKRPV